MSDIVWNDSTSRVLDGVALLLKCGCAGALQGIQVSQSLQGSLSIAAACSTLAYLSKATRRISISVSATSDTLGQRRVVMIALLDGQRQAGTSTLSAPLLRD